MKRRNKKPSTTNFNDPQKGFDSTSKRIVFILLIVIIAVMIATTFFIIYKYGSFRNMFVGETTESTTEEVSESVEIEKVEGKKNLLFAVTSPGESELYNLFVVGVNMNEGKTSIISIPTCLVDASDKTLEEEFKLGGISQIEYILERMLNMDFDAHLSATQNGYKFFLTELGSGVEFDIPEDLQFSTTNYTLSLTAGKQDLSFDTFVKLLRFDEWSGGREVSYTRRGELLGALYTQYAKPKFVTRDVDKFTYRMTHINSDISPEDYVNDLPALEYITSADFKVNVITPKGSFSGGDDTLRFTLSKAGTNELHEALTLTVPTEE